MTGAGQGEGIDPGRAVILAGPPGAGKTSAGRALAARLGRDFVDMDARIAAEAGMPIGAIFEREGEAGFRRRERAAVVGLREPREPALVVATGGGCLMDERNRRDLAALGTVVVLTAGLETLTARLTGDPEGRPLLAGGRLAQLLAERQPLYDAQPWQVDTEGRSPEEVARAVIDLLRAVAIRPTVEPIALPVRAPADPAARLGSRVGYAALVAPGLLDLIGPLLAARGMTGRCAVVTDATVEELYGERVLASLAGAGVEAPTIALPPGEAQKGMASLGALHEAFLAAGLDRGSTVLALGGGVVGDLAGLAAATWLRGLTLVHAPTTLLAMVDASVGGKAAINLPAGKNLVGAFKHPALVLVDPAVLATLPADRLGEGLAEMVKAAIIGDPALLALLDRRPAPDDGAAWQALIVPALAVKAAIVSRDPGERGGERAKLNLGHTFAHAFEQRSGYRVPHGQAVAVGLVAAARLADRLGLARRPGLAAETEALLRLLGLPVSLAHLGLPPDPAADLAAMGRDKKWESGRATMVLARDWGEVVGVGGVAEEELLAVLAGM